MDDNNNKPTEIKTPVNSAVNKLREGLLKEHQNKIDAQVKKTVDAINAAEHEKEVLQEMEDDFNAAKDKLKNVLSDLKVGA